MKADDAHALLDLVDEYIDDCARIDPDVELPSNSDDDEDEE